ncbi:MAG: threonine ammonia-lyase [Bdellovibrionales bacterium]|nr:threonine ammonia-lyase [Bdellovibrionales bacterium]
MEPITFASIETAWKVLHPILPVTPLIRNEWLSKKYECDVYLKLEIAQPIGSFKIRGATHRISLLSEAEKKKGVIAASAGNHAQGVAWGARHFNTNALIVMPETAPLMKIQNTSALGATIHLEGENYDDSFQVALKIAKETGRTYIHAFHDPAVIAGQGTAGIEILQQLPDVDFVVGSMGGGGMLAGVGVAIKNSRPKAKVIGCQATNASSMVASLKKHKLTTTDFLGTFADGISVKAANPDLFKVLETVVDEVFSCEEEEIAMNVLQFMETAKIVVEGSGAVVLGALDRYVEQMHGKKVVLVVSGGNIDVNLVSRIIDRGLIRLGRRIHLKVQISDRPGSLSKLTSLIGALKANILQATHDRSDRAIKLDETEVELMLETRGPEHSAEVIDALEKHCKRVEMMD